MAPPPGTRDASGTVGGSTSTNEENTMRGIPHLHYVAGAGSRPTWVGRTLVMGEDPHDVRHLYQREDALPLPPDPEPSARAPRRFGLRRILGLAAG
jgi:hypothetical protein